MMTTPENFRRRQLVEGAMLIVVGIAMILQGWYFANEDRAQRVCVEDKFRELSVALESRADLTERETAQNKALWMIYARAAGLVQDKEEIKLTPKQQEKFNRELVNQLLEYKRVITSIERERQENPVPPYPVGVCGN